METNVAAPLLLEEAGVPAIAPSAAWGLRTWLLRGAVSVWAIAGIVLYVHSRSSGEAQAPLSSPAGTPSALTSAGSGPLMTFAILGDWGRDGSSEQVGVANAMGDYCASNQCRNILSVGDNFYDNGVKSDTTGKWANAWSNVYTAPSLTVPWMVVLGNHDYHSAREQYQIQFSQEHPSKWVLPDRNYVRDFPGADGKPLMRIAFIDTTPKISAYLDDSNFDSKDLSAQVFDTAAFLTTNIASSPAPFNFVIGHHPVYSAGKSNGDQPEIEAAILQIMADLRVTAYISGHDHNLQYLRRDNIATADKQSYSFHQFVTGAGSSLDTGMNDLHPYKQFMRITHGFMGLKVYSADKAVMEIVDTDQNEVAYTVEFAPRGKI